MNWKRRAMASPSKMGPRHVRGQMNKSEADYAGYLQGLLLAGKIDWFSFESVTLRLAKLTSFTPDFVVVLADGTIEFHEVKAGAGGPGASRPLVEDDAMVKLKVASEMFPATFRLVWKDRTTKQWVEKIY